MLFLYRFNWELKWFFFEALKSELSVLRYLAYLSLVSGLGLVMYCLYNLSLVRIDLIILEVTHGFFGVTSH